MKKQRNKTPAPAPQVERKSESAGVETILRLKSQHPIREQIQQRAYEIHQARGGEPGRELDDWLQAERELIGQSGEPPEGKETSTV